ncbi:MAG: hypothetical protein KC656_00250 [Myxococcales bacterium]|nr:hypothetical protein [Myxococcales bacterium]MCB9690946.1 hypothetical protein [Alphaproteobacteria bacterium]
MLALMLATSAFAAPVRAALGTTVTLPRKVVEPGEPMMVYLAMQNRTDQRLYFEEHADGPCFVKKFVTLEMSPEAVPKPVPESCPFKSRAVMPGEVLDFVVSLNEIFELTADRYQQVKVTWKDGGPETYSRVTETAGPIQVLPPFFSERVKKGDVIFLPNKNTLTFLRHEWKPSTVKGDPPQLTIHFKLQLRGEGEEEKSVTIAADKQHQFRLDGYLFDVGAFQFDQWMVFRGWESAW